MTKRQHKPWYIVVAALMMAALFGGGIMIGGTMPNVIWAASGTPSTPALEQAVVAAQNTELEGTLPTQELLATLYDQVAPSVVNIQVEVDVAESLFPGLPFGEDSIPSIPSQGEGSGFIFDMDGHIVTNNHVVEDALSIVVNFSNGMWATAELVARDPQADLAVLKVTPPSGMEWRPLTLAGDNLRPGYYVAALGSPFGLDETMTVGVISAIGRAFPTGDATTGSYSLPDVIQTDTAINPGNSGGPLLNLMGEVVGVNFAINSMVGTNSGVGFAIPVSVVRQVVPALIADGAFRYSYLGISGQTIGAAVAEENDLAENTLGVFVGEVVDGGPAEAAGVQANDIIVGIDDQNVQKFEDLISYLFQHTTPDQAVTLHIQRSGDATEIQVTLGERPQAIEEERGGEQQLGIEVAEAINIARDSVADAGLMTTIDNASAKRDTVDGTDVWTVTLTGEGKTATVVVDATSGDVLELNLQ